LLFVFGRHFDGFLSFVVKRCLLVCWWWLSQTLA
jgi:hypothetical protein